MLLWYYLFSWFISSLLSDCSGVSWYYANTELNDRIVHTREIWYPTIQKIVDGSRNVSHDLLLISVMSISTKPFIKSSYLIGCSSLIKSISQNVLFIWIQVSTFDSYKIFLFSSLLTDSGDLAWTLTSKITETHAKRVTVSQKNRKIIGFQLSMSDYC